MGGTVTGMTGGSLVLWSKGSPVTVSANGAFNVTTTASTGDTYEVLIQRQPVTNPAQTCTLTNGSGTVASAAITNIAVTCSTVYARFAYALSSFRGSDYTNTISQYRVDATTGQLYLNGLIVTPRGPLALAVHPGGRFAYLSTYIAQFQSTVTTYDIDAASGELIERVSATGDSRQGPLTLNPAGSFLYDIGGGGGISGRGIDQTTGNFTTGGGGIGFPNQVFAGLPVFDVTGKFAFSVVIDQSAPAANSFSVHAFAVNAATGEFTDKSSFALSGTANLPVVDSAGHVYLVSASTNDVRGFNFSQTTGELTEIAGSPFAGIKAIGLVMDPENRFAFARDPATGAISVLNISASGALSLSSTRAVAGVGLTPTSIEPTGRFLYAASDDERIFSFAIDRTNGALGDARHVRTRTPPRSLQFVTGAQPATVSAKFAYVSNHDDSTVSGYDFTGAGGGLRPLASGPFPAVDAPNSIAIHRARFVVVANEGNATVSSYTIGANGALSPAAGAPFPVGQQPRGVAITPRGNRVYTANFMSGDISAYQVDANTGVFTPLSGPSFPSPYPLPAGSTLPTNLSVDPFGEALFVLDPGTSSVLSFKLWDGQSVGGIAQQNTGEVISPPKVGAIGNGANTLTIGPSGEFLYVPNSTDNSISVLRIGPSGSYATPSALTPVTGSPFTTGTGMAPMHVAVDPTGRFVYSANCGNDTISAFRSDAETGALTQISGSPFATGRCPFALAMDPAGTFLLVTNSRDNTLGRFNIDATSGALTAATPASVPTGPAPFGVGIVAQPH